MTLRPCGRWVFLFPALGGKWQEGTQMIDSSDTVGDRRAHCAGRRARRAHRPRARVPRLPGGRPHDGPGLHGLCALRRHVASPYGGDDRIAAQIVTGIGFLGAGLIFREGLTRQGRHDRRDDLVRSRPSALRVAHRGVHRCRIRRTVFAVMILELRIVTKNIRPSNDGDGDDYAAEARTARSDAIDSKSRASADQAGRVQRVAETP